MKTVKSALLGSKQLIDHNADVLLTQLKEIIKEHRSLIIMRLLKDLPTYLDYKFEMKPGKEMIMKIREDLTNLKNEHVDISAYDQVLQQLLSRAVVHLTNEPFYREIDERLAVYVSEKEIKFN